jgi:hypothetical protein
MIVGYLAACQKHGWEFVQGSKLYGISGMAALGQQGNTIRYLIIHDNKQPGEPRLAIITNEKGSQPLYKTLTWPDSNPPVDGEALSAMPGFENSFMVMSSDGILFHLKIDPSTNLVQVAHTYSIAQIPSGSNYEGLSLQKINDTYLVVWGHRGNGNPGVIYWSVFDPDVSSFSSIGSESFVVPWPVENVRHISDMKLDPSGKLYIASATDTGDDGPFQSAVYLAGIFDAQGQTISFKKNPDLKPIMKFDKHKVEALEFVPGTSEKMILGSDDENMGGWIYTTQ